MTLSNPLWLAPDGLDEALAVRAEHGEDATVVAGGTLRCERTPPLPVRRT